jgi:DNA-binding NarL/FixJ family response regulator
MGNEIRIVIAEDHPFFRDGLRHALEKEKRFHVVAEAADGLTAFDCIRTLKPDLAVLDISLPALDGCALARKLRAERIPVEIVFLTICDDQDIFEEALEYDVKGYLLKDCTAAEIVSCVKAVCSGQNYASPSMTTYLVGKARGIETFARRVPGFHLLTPQERAILKRVAHDKTSKEIAQEMKIAPKTVDAHRLNICGKLKIHGNHVLSRFAAQHRNEI